MYPYTLIDRHCSCPEFEFAKGEFILNDINKSENDLELRLYLKVLGTFSSVTVLTKKAGKVNGDYYHKRFDSFGSSRPDSALGILKWEKYPFKKFPIQDNNLDSIVTELLYYNVGRLPNLSDIYKGSYLGAFRVVYKINGHVGEYQFGNTEELMTKFPKVQEYKDYMSIARLLGKLTGKYREQVFQSEDTGR